MPTSRKVAFLDRDGVINLDFGYVYQWENFKLTYNVTEGLKLLQNLGYELVIVTNQSGIARGYYSLEQYLELTEKYRKYFLENDVRFLEILFCPHHPEGKIREYAYVCNCRKPDVGMISQLMEKYPIDLSKSILIGDKATDLELAENAGIGNAFLVGSKETEFSSFSFHKVFPTLYDVANRIKFENIAGKV